MGKFYFSVKFDMTSDARKQTQYNFAKKYNLKSDQ